jgi:hypothetical protein
MVTHMLFLCGDGDDAKQAIRDLLHNRFGWRSFVDVADRSMARGAEMLPALWDRGRAQHAALQRERRSLTPRSDGAVRTPRD